MIAYTVACVFDEPSVCDEWIAWLRDEHLGEVIAGGAVDAEVVRFESLQREAASGGGSVKCEVRYHFSSREAFAAYERDHAPRLRTEGLKRFPPERGVKYERSLASVVVRPSQIVMPARHAG